MELTEDIRRRLMAFQRLEITEYHIYKRLAGTMNDPENRALLEHIAADELRHYEDLKGYTGRQVNPNRFEMWFYYTVSRLLGLTFGIKLMEMGEQKVQGNYVQLMGVVPEIERWIEPDM